MCLNAIHTTSAQAKTNEVVAVETRASDLERQVEDLSNQVWCGMVLVYGFGRKITAYIYTYVYLLMYIYMKILIVYVYHICTYIYICTNIVHVTSYRST